MTNIFPIHDLLISRKEKEDFLRQRAVVFWLFGPSGSGKTTIAVELEKRLFQHQKTAVVLDGDNLRSGVNQGLGFDKTDRMENIRRTAEIAKILVDNGIIVICSLVCPLQSMRTLAREILGEDYIEVYIKTSIDTLIERDTKGLYKKASEGKITNFTGVNATFEEGVESEIIIKTKTMNPQQAAEYILSYRPL